MIVTASVSASAFATVSVPFANLGISKHPIGPFHTTVLASFTASLKILAVSGPISSPSHPSGISPAFLLSCQSSWKYDVITVQKSL